MSQGDAEHRQSTGDAEPRPGYSNGATITAPSSGHDYRRPVFANASKWVRAPEGGVLRWPKRIGEAVSEGEQIGIIANPYEEGDTPVRSPRRGIIIGRTTLPIVNLGDALFHIAWSQDLAKPKSGEREAANPEPLMDEDEII